LADGKIKEIGKINGTDKLKSVDLAKKVFVNSTVVKKWKSNKETICRIRTRHPSLEIICSEDHGIFVRINGEVKEISARELTKEHMLLMPVRAEINYAGCWLIPLEIKEIKKARKNIQMIDICVDNQNFIANGLLVHNSAVRFERIIEQEAQAFFKRICEHLNQTMKDPKVKGIIAGGPGPTKYEVINSEHLFPDVKKKILGSLDTGYTDETGINELVNKSGELIQKLEIQREKELVDRFIKEAVTGGLATYGPEEVKEALNLKKVSSLLLSEQLDEKTISEFTELAEQRNVEVEMVSVQTLEGKQFFSGFRGIGALLRYR
jgi:hypothetical protein